MLYAITLHNAAPKTPFSDHFDNVHKTIVLWSVSALHCQTASKIDPQCKVRGGLSESLWQHSGSKDFTRYL